MSKEGWNLGMALGAYAADQERRYSLDEAKQELARRECALHGHYFTEIVAMGSNDPRALSCSHCGREWPVGEGVGG